MLQGCYGSEQTVPAFLISQPCTPYFGRLAAINPFMYNNGSAPVSRRSSAKMGQNGLKMGLSISRNMLGKVSGPPAVPQPSPVRGG